MTTGGGAEFSHGEDFVAARLSIDIPTDGIASLRELTQEMDRWRVAADASGRSGDSFVGYLKQSAEMAERAAEAMERLSAAQQGVGGGGGNGVPQRYADPFTGAEAGTGQGRSGGGGAAEAAAQIDEFRQGDPRGYLAQQAARGNLRPSDIPVSHSATDVQAAADRVHEREQQNIRRQQENPAATKAIPGFGGGEGGSGGTWGNLAQQMLNETGGGGGGYGGAGMAGMAGKALRGSAAALGGLQGGALGSLLKGGGIAGAALAGYGALQMGGEEYQKYKNMGLIRGGGAAEGFGQDMSARIMAMNPFLSNDQSRQIIQAGLSEGYQGQAFETVTEFMKKNFLDMNISIGDSMKMLRTNVNEGGQSITGLATDLAILKDLSKDGAMTTPERVANYASTSEALIKAGGVSGPEAGKTARIMGDIWSDSQVLKGKAGDIIGQLGSSPSGQMAAYALSGMTPPTGALPGTYFGRDDARDRQATMGLIKKVAAMAQQSSGGDVKNGALLFWRMMKSTAGVDLDRAQAEQMYQRAISGQDPLGASEQQDKAEVAKQVAVQERGTLSQMGGGLLSGAAGVGMGMLGAVKFLGQSFGDWMSDDPRKSLGEDWGAYRNNLASHAAAADRAGARYSMPVFDQITKEFGPDGFDIVDASGKAQKLQLNSQKQMEQLSKGDLKFRPKGGSTTYSLSDAVGVTKEDLMSMGPSRVEGTLRVEMDPSTQQAAQQAGLRIPQTIKLTPHEQQANMAYGDARPNNAPPGEGAIARGAR